MLLENGLTEEENSTLAKRMEIHLLRKESHIFYLHVASISSGTSRLNDRTALKWTIGSPPTTLPKA